MTDIITYSTKLLLYMGLALPCLYLLRKLWKQKQPAPTTLHHELAWLCYGCLLVGLACMTVLFNGGELGAQWGPVNLQPFYVIESTLRSLERGNWKPFCINFLGNIAIFIPVGFFPPLLWKSMDLGKTGLQGLGISLLIELCQLPQIRSTDVDDLWLNTLGALVGYGLYRILKQYQPELTAKFQVNPPIKEN